MNLNSQQIEMVTAGVLQELRSRGVIASTANSGASTAETVAVADTECAVPAGQVITEECLVRLSAAGRTVAIPPTAIITPSGRDYIRQHGISVKRGTKASLQGSGTLLTIGDCPSAVSAAGVAGWQSESADCEWSAARLTLSQIESNGRVVCCGGQPAIVSCLLNRDPNCRAAVITPGAAHRQLVELMNPQVWCLSPEGWSFAELLHLFRASGLTDVSAPSNWREAGGRR